MYILHTHTYTHTHTHIHTTHTRARVRKSTETQSLDAELMINLLPAHLGCLDDLIYDFVSDCSTHAVSRFD